MSLPPCPHWPPWLIPPLFRLLPPLSRLLPPLQTSQPAPGTTEIPKTRIGTPKFLRATLVYFFNYFSMIQAMARMKNPTIAWRFGDG